jgi:membrane protein insertase Oxa1/YidC/SpoIIIJ
MLWSSLIDVVRASLFVVAHWCGGSFGAAIFLASVATRLVMLPLTLSATRRRLVRERNAVTTLDRRGLLDGLLTFPPAAAIYSAIRAAGSRAGGFLWIGNLATPDRALAVVASLIAAALAWLAMATPAGKTAGPHAAPLVLSAVVTFLILSHMSAGLAVYSVANSLIGAAERAIALRTLPAPRA